ncbi:hypothetical protein IGK30_000097 [Enterococcus sp. AZ178]|uniref:hypothetical protein n=1 Tax=Enterococcus sp. AZ178 TaxID=2774822 RepID=UPI003F22E98E
MSLVYNNKKLIGKCSKFAIEKVQGTSPFVMLENFEPKQPQLNENQQIVLDWLKIIYNSPIIINPIAVVFSLHNELVKDSEIDAVESYEELGFDEEIQVLQVFSQWAKEQGAE